ncbi:MULTISPECIES: hypothetical protein [Thauera]|uniref:hypothetical protein n=1 Tax=Thauera TaxID=33057 RepID=UPI0023F0AE96|nr:MULTISPECIES: hypothetical protein [Thauera]MDD3674229.1 hypothetical protein [Thauera propionica]
MSFDGDFGADGKQDGDQSGQQGCADEQQALVPAPDRKPGQRIATAAARELPEGLAG